jgi:hypothetical protein
MSKPSSRIRVWKLSESHLTPYLPVADDVRCEIDALYDEIELLKNPMQTSNVEPKEKNLWKFYEVSGSRDKTPNEPKQESLAEVVLNTANQPNFGGQEKKIADDIAKEAKAWFVRFINDLNPNGCYYISTDMLKQKLEDSK